MHKILLIPISLLSAGLILKGATQIHFSVATSVSYQIEDSATLKELLQSRFNCKSVKPVIYKRLPDLSGVHPAIRKKVFIRLVLPAVLIAKKEIELQRSLLLKLVRKRKQGIPLSKEENRYLSQLMKKYKAKNIAELLTKLRNHPTSLIVAQAAIESGWGTSRFTKLANNLFGIWQFKGNSGVKARQSDAILRRYNTILESIEEYLYNLNAGWAYENFRKARLYTDNPFVLVEHLRNYSILRDEYTQRLKAVIEHNKLYKYDECRLEN